ncbi:MAG: NADH-quinone oxidoreductase subunit M [candidate division Zixibacteria bacterium]|nr:NADH-quinone oxidoreductase subunit M [candidate division Zixibacteria bacterium]
MSGLLSWMIFLPLIGAGVIMALPKDNHRGIRAVATVAAFLPLVLAILLLAGYDPSTAAFQFQENAAWIPALNVNYHLGVDGLSVPMLALTALLCFLACLISYNITNRVKEYFAFYLLLEAGMLGVFAALDFFLFYVFWEVMLVPMYFLIGIWGGPRREYAAIKFFLYTLFGSIFMLVAILALYFTSTPHTLSITDQIARAPGMTHGFQMFAFVFFFIAFAIKIPTLPFHTWLPDAHVEAPTAVSVLLAGVLLKMGTYGLLRISLPMFPMATKYFAWPMAALGVAGIVYGAFVCMAQKDLKKLVAYSSVSHMGYCLLGIAAYGSVAALTGCMFQMVSHGLITGALFILVGVIYDRAHTREIDAYGGMWVKVPVYSGIMVLFVLGSLGLPGLSGFVSEFMVFLGAFPYFKITVAVGVVGVLLTAAYFLRMIQKMFLGTVAGQTEHLSDINAREMIAVAPLAVMMIVLGVYPALLADYIKATIVNLVKVIGA